MTMATIVAIIIQLLRIVRQSFWVIVGVHQSPHALFCACERPLKLGLARLSDHDALQHSPEKIKETMLTYRLSMYTR